MECKSADYWLKSKKLNKEELEKTLSYYSKLYYEGDPAISDVKYDKLEKLYIDNYGEIETGSSNNSNVELDYYMGSLTKIKENESSKLTTHIERMRKTYGDNLKYQISEKIDGISAQLVYKNGNITMFTKGDSRYGTDITNLVPYLLDNNRIPILNNCHIRGELILYTEDFNKFFCDDKDPRTTVCGIVNKISRNGVELDDIDINKLNHIHFIAYRKMDSIKKISTQYNFLNKSGFETPIVNQCVNNLDIDELKDILVESIESVPYIIDGIVITCDISVEFPSDKNPVHSIAFKEIPMITHTIVTDVKWTISDSGRLTPVIYYEPFNICNSSGNAGKTYSKVSGHNASFIKEHNIHADVEIDIIIAGGIIPNIYNVYNYDESWAEPPYNYTWNGKYIYINKYNKNNELVIVDEQEIKKIVRFFVAIGVENMKYKVCEKLYNYGLDTIKKILEAMLNDDMIKELVELPRFGDKLVNKLVDNIREVVNNIPLSSLMYASGIFENIGIKKFDIMLTDPMFDNEGFMKSVKHINEMKELRNRLKNLKGIKSVADNFVDNLSTFVTFYKSISTYVTILYPINCDNEIVENNGGVFEGLVIVFTGITKDKFVDKIENNGGIVQDGVTLKTNLLVKAGKSIDTASSKEKKAIEYNKGKGNIRIIELNEFNDEYFNKI
jgi:NAD-dependent DNA ligase